MLDLTSLLSSFGALSHISIWTAILVGVIIGVACGSIPGGPASIVMATSLPILIYFDPLTGITFLTAVYTGSISAGAMAAILYNMPGTPGSVATGFDGFPMNQQGKSNLALGIQLYSSVFGAVFSYVLFIVALEPATHIAAYLGPAARLAIGILALLIVASLAGKSLFRGLIAALLGLTLGALGPTSGGISRSEFLHVPILYDGLPLVPTIIGLIAFSELLGFLGKEFVVDTRNRQRPSFGQIVGALPAWVRHRRHALGGGVIGFLVGVVPAAGSTIASTFAWTQARSFSRKPDRFGRGAPEGVVVAESANNASEGGAMLTTVTLGIPGSGDSAIVLSGLLVFGLVPGPAWLDQNLDFVYRIGVVNVVTAIVMIPILALFMRYASLLVLVPVRVFAPFLAVLSSLGVYASRNAIEDVFILWIFAFVGWLMKRHGYPPMALLLGVILGPGMDSEAFRVPDLYGSVGAILSQPVVLVCLVLGVALITNEVRIRRRSRTRDRDVQEHR